MFAATLVLVLDWAAGHVTDLRHRSASWMVATHGVADALGFALCSVLARRRLARYS